jgi:hypothetical protein
MGHSAATRKFLLTVRKVLKALLRIRHGCSSKETESGLVTASRLVIGRLSEAENNAWSIDGEKPEWLTEEVARCAYVGDFEPPAPAPTVCAGATRKQASRACDVFLSENKSRLVTENGGKEWRAAGLVEWRSLPALDRHEFVKKAAVPRTRMRGHRGYWVHQCRDDDALPAAMAAAPGTPPRRCTAKDIIDRAQCIDDGTTPMKQLFVKAGKDLGVSKTGMRKIIPISSRVWRGGAPTKSGRKTGFKFISDAHLLGLLDPHLSDSSRWSRRIGRPLMTLNSTKKRVFMKIPEVHQRIAYRTFLKQLRRGRLGVGAGSKRVDVCDYCNWFDNVLVKSIAPLLRRTRASLKELDATFWIAFDAMVASHPVWSKTETFVQAESPAFLRAFAGHLACHGVPHISEEVQAIATKVVLDLNGDDGDNPGFIKQVEAVVAHWKLRDAQREALRVDVDTPRIGTLFIQWDFGDEG